jgi:hypothetical protein
VRIRNSEKNRRGDDEDDEDDEVLFADNNHPWQKMNQGAFRPVPRQEKHQGAKRFGRFS